MLGITFHITINNFQFNLFDLKVKFVFYFIQ